MPTPFCFVSPVYAPVPFRTSPAHAGQRRDVLSYLTEALRTPASTGDVVDFWRVEVLKGAADPKTMRLRAEK